MAVTKCSYCGKENEESTPNCPSCGTPLRPQPEPPSEIQTGVAAARLWKGAVWLAIGLAVTVGSYLVAAPGGTYWLAWGAIIYGAAQLVIGLLDWRKPQAQLELEAALEQQFQTAVLRESAGDLEGALAIYEDLARNHPDTRVGRNAQDTAASMRANRPASK